MALMSEEIAKSRAVPASDILALYDLHAPGLLRFLLAVCGRQDWAQDISQESFLRLMSALQRGESIAAPREWLFQAARALLVDRIAERDGSDETKQPYPVQQPVGFAQAEFAEFHRRALRLASPRELEILELRAEGFTYEETARILGISSGTVGSVLARVVRKLRRHLRTEEKR